MKIKILFSPQFKSFGVDIIKKMDINEEIEEITGYCIGIERNIAELHKEIQDYSKKLFDIEKMEKEWINGSIDWSILQRLEAACGPSVVGQIIVSDRRIGAQFVKGARIRPSFIKDLVARDPQMAPLRYVSGLLNFLFDDLTNNRPDFVFCYAVAGAFAFSLEKVCNALRIPFYIIASPRIDNLHYIETSSDGKNLRFMQSYNQFCLENKDSALDAVQSAHKYLENIRTGNKAYPTMRLNSDNIVLRLAKTVLKITLTSWRYWPNWETHYQYIRRAYWLLMKDWRRMRQAHYFDELGDSQGDYIYFPLHVDPEASTMVRAPLFLDQFFIIEQLAKITPSNVQIVVKEHEPMLGLRPTGFYEALKRIPKVVLLAPENSSSNLMLESNLVCTITGTAAWEATLRGVPSIVFGEFPYTWLQGISEVSISDGLAEKVANAVATAPTSDQSLLHLLAFSFEFCFTMDDQLLWGDYSRFDESIRLCAASRVAREVLEVHKNLVAHVEDAG